MKRTFLNRMNKASVAMAILMTIALSLNFMLPMNVYADTTVNVAIEVELTPANLVFTDIVDSINILIVKPGGNETIDLITDYDDIITNGVNLDIGDRIYLSNVQTKTGYIWGYTTHIDSDYGDMPLSVNDSTKTYKLRFTASECNHSHWIWSNDRHTCNWCGYSRDEGDGFDNQHKWVQNNSSTHKCDICYSSVVVPPNKGISDAVITLQTGSHRFSENTCIDCGYVKPSANPTNPTPNTPSSTIPSPTPTTPPVTTPTSNGTAKKPFIIGEDGASWDNMASKIKSAKKGSTIYITSNNTPVSSKVLSSLKEKDVILSISTPNGTIWSINGKDITTVKNFDLSIKYGVNNIPANLRKKAVTVNKGTSSAQFTIANTESFGFSADLTVNFKTDKAGKTVKLYSYNSDKKTLGLAAESTIGENGKCTFNGLKQGGDFLTVII